MIALAIWSFTGTLKIHKWPWFFTLAKIWVLVWLAGFALRINSMLFSSSSLFYFQKKKFLRYEWSEDLTIHNFQFLFQWSKENDVRNILGSMFEQKTNRNAEICVFQHCVKTRSYYNCDFLNWNQFAFRFANGLL